MAVPKCNAPDNAIFRERCHCMLDQDSSSAGATANIGETSNSQDEGQSGGIEAIQDSPLAMAKGMGPGLGPGPAYVLRADADEAMAEAQRELQVLRAELARMTEEGVSRLALERRAGEDNQREEEIVVPERTLATEFDPTSPSGLETSLLLNESALLSPRDLRSLNIMSPSLSVLNSSMASDGSELGQSPPRDVPPVALVLCVKARSLVQMDVLATLDPLIAVYKMDTDTGLYHFTDQSDVIVDSLNPDFETRFAVEHCPSDKYLLRVFAAGGPSGAGGGEQAERVCVGGDELVGSAVVELDDVLGQGGGDTHTHIHTHTHTHTHTQTLTHTPGAWTRWV
jgi:hypothetical protein